MTSSSPTAVRALGAALFAVLAGTAAVRAQMATADRVQGPGFWPTQGTPARADFLGPEACAKCHRAQAAQQPLTSMARTAARAAEAAILDENPALQFRSGPWSYTLATHGGRALYSVRGPIGEAVVPIGWAFGAGKVGQTYVYEKDGAFHESRLSYFASLHGADFTPARAITDVRDAWEAAGRRVPDAEARRCFGCHTTASTASGAFDTRALIPGITCEACHGPGRRHVEAVEKKQLGAALDAILNPAKLDPAASVDSCGACHATFWDVQLAGDIGIAALRSQPNRLQSSRCWGKGDARITCVACHDPHVPLVEETASYDSRCLSCHVQAGAKAAADHPGRGCPVARENCVSCHMPKYEAPGMHHEFTDHRIRVVRAGGAGGG